MASCFCTKQECEALAARISALEARLNNHIGLSIPSAHPISSGFLQGQKGDKGDKGERGLQGERGLKGDRGERGEKGIKGDKGERGIQGERGLTGKDGKDGKQGVKGDSGKDGKPGKDGINGKNGLNGKPGYNGADGKDGRNGVNGLNGTTTIITKIDNTALKPVADKVNKLEKELNGAEMELSKLEKCCDKISDMLSRDLPQIKRNTNPLNIDFVTQFTGIYNKIDDLAQLNSNDFDTMLRVLTLNNRGINAINDKVNTINGSLGVAQSGINYLSTKPTLSSTDLSPILNCCNDLKTGQQGLAGIINSNTTGIYNKIENENRTTRVVIIEKSKEETDKIKNELDSCCSVVRNLSQFVRANLKNSIDRLIDLTIDYGAITTVSGKQITEIKRDTTNISVKTFDTYVKLLSLITFMENCCKNVNDLLNNDVTINRPLLNNIKICCDNVLKLLQNGGGGGTPINDAKLNQIISCCASVLTTVNEILQKINSGGGDSNLGIIVDLINNFIDIMGQNFREVIKLLKELLDRDSNVDLKPVLDCCNDLKIRIGSVSYEVKTGFSDNKTALTTCCNNLANLIKAIKGGDIDLTPVLQCCADIKRLVENEHINTRYRLSTDIASLFNSVQLLKSETLTRFDNLSKQLKTCCDQLDNRIVNGFDDIRDRLILLKASIDGVLNDIKTIVEYTGRAIDLINNATTLIKLRTQHIQDIVDVILKELVACCKKIIEIEKDTNLLPGMDFKINQLLTLLFDDPDTNPDWVNKILIALAGILSALNLLKGVDYDRICTIVRTCVDYNKINDHTTKVINFLDDDIENYAVNFELLFKRLQKCCDDGLIEIGKGNQYTIDLSTKLTLITNTVNNIDTKISNTYNTVLTLPSLINNISVKIGDVTLKLDTIVNITNELKLSLQYISQYTTYIFNNTEDNRRYINGGGNRFEIRDMLNAIEVDYTVIDCISENDSVVVKQKGLTEILELILTRQKQQTDIICMLQQEEEQETQESCFVLLPDPSAVTNTAGCYFLFYWILNNPQTEQERRYSHRTQLAEPLELFKQPVSDPLAVWNQYFADVYYIMGNQWASLRAANRARRNPLYKGFFDSKDEARRFFNSISGLTQIPIAQTNNPHFTEHDNQQVQIVNQGKQLILRKVCIGCKEIDSDQITTLYEYRRPLTP